MKFFTLFVFIALFFVGNIYSEIIKVPSEQPTIQDGINVANNSDTVLVNPGTYVQSINFIGKNIVVGSLFLTTGESSYISGTVIDGNNSASVVTFANGEDSTTLLCGFTLKNGSAEMGGGIFCDGASPGLRNLIIRENSVVTDGGGMTFLGSSVSIEDVTVEENTAEVGAGIFCAESDLFLLNVIVENNSALRDGGGFQIHRSNLQIDSCTISNNQAQNGYGGGLNYLNDEGTDETFEITITNTDFVGNSSLVSIGAMGVVKFDQDSSIVNVLIDQCDFKDNMSDVYGGLRITGESVNCILTNSSFIGNETLRYAAGAGIDANSTGVVSNCLFAFNSAASDGGDWNSGGVSVWSDAQVDFMNCTFVENWAAYGAGLTVGNGSIATTTNCIFWGHWEDQIALAPWNNVGGTLTVSYCDIEGGQDDVNIVDEMSILIWGEGNIDREPLFVDWEEGDFHLSDYSLCIGVGTSEGASDTDMEGNPRPDPPESNPDMGAYENSRAVPLYSTISLSPDSIYMNLGSAEIDSQIVTISNTGTADLTYFVNTDLITVADSQNYALVFDGSVKTVDIANPDSFDFTNDFTIMAWIKTDDSGIIVAKSSAQDDPGPKALFINSGKGALCFDVGYVWTMSGNRILNDDIWHHVAVTAEENGTALVKLYVDGEPDGEEYIDIAQYPEDGFGLRLGFDGREPDEFPNYNGVMDEVSIWDRALSPAEIKTIMSDGMAGSDSGLSGYWPMDEGSGTTCNDHSSNENNGTLLNNPVWEVSNVPINPWLTCQPTSGLIPVSGQTTMTALFNVADLVGSDYFANIVITSNDPFNSRVIIPVYIEKEPSGLEGHDLSKLQVTYELSQNYPNPFNPRTIINYQLPKTSEVELSIYNILGQKVVMLVSEKQPAGKYTIEWDATGFASGVYYYKLKCNPGFVQIKKLILLK